MTEQQERMAMEVLSTVRSLQKCDNRDLISVLSRVADEIFRDKGRLYKVVLDSYVDDDENSRKIQVIKVMREHTGLGLKEAKEIVDLLDPGKDGRGVAIVTGVGIDVAEKVIDDLQSVGMRPRLKKE